MKYNIEVLNDYLAKGLLLRQDHPSLPLYIWNYSRTAQYDKIWDTITLNMRATVTDHEGNVVARSFEKFFNYEELAEFPDVPYKLFEKMDGSLILLFNYNGEWIVSSKGSFTSEQALKATKILKNHYLECLPMHLTYSFELIGRSNQIVLDYGPEDKLVMLAAFNKKGGEYHINEFIDCGIELVTEYKTWGEDWDTLKKEISDNKEGYVVRFDDGFRMKIKGETYIRLHKVMTNLSTIDIWEHLRDDRLEELLAIVPDEMDLWVKSMVRDLKYSFYSIDDRAGKMHDYFRYGKFGDVDPEPTKKEFAEYVKQFPVELGAVMFSMWDKKPYDLIIWKMIKPNYSKFSANEL
jgi:RNA ligase